MGSGHCGLVTGAFPGTIVLLAMHYVLPVLFELAEHVVIMKEGRGCCRREGDVDMLVSVGSVGSARCPGPSETGRGQSADTAASRFAPDLVPVAALTPVATISRQKVFF